MGAHRSVRFLAACMAVGLFPAGSTAAQDRYAYDFGTPGSPVAEGYEAVQVDMNTRAYPAYSAEKGFGILNVAGRMNSRDRETALSADPALRDFVTANSDYTFRRDLPNGGYRVTAWVGDWAARTTTVTVGDGKKALATLDFTCAANEIKARSVDVTVDTGTLEFVVSDPANNTRVLNALVIEKAGSASRAPASAAAAAPAAAVIRGPAAPPAKLPAPSTPRFMERLDRGLVAVPCSGGTAVSWRLLGTDPAEVAFDVYRDGSRVNALPITGATFFMDASGIEASRYEVRSFLGGKETGRESAAVWRKEYLSIPLRKPEGGTTPDGVAYTYAANDASVGDLDGDGRYEIVLKWDPSNSKDNSLKGHTGEVFLDAYGMDGTFLWRIALGRNIRAGAHYTQFLVYDFDCDGKAEVVLKTADGTTDSRGVIIGDGNADHRNSDGYVLTGPEFLTVFEGSTGRMLRTVAYDPPRGEVPSWGDAYGNRVDRFLACVAYLDGVHPSIVMCRGYYTRSVLVAYDLNGGSLEKRWRFDSDDPGNGTWVGQGNHQVSVADVDYDGRDEIIYGSMAIDDDGRGLYNTGLGHGDASHLGDLDPSRPGLEYFQVHEDKNGPFGVEYRDPATGSLIWGVRTGRDTGRGLSADIDPAHPGEEIWSAGAKFFTADGKDLGSAPPSSVNFAIWWDGDPLRELLDHTWLGNDAGAGVGRIDKWDPAAKVCTTLLEAVGTRSNNGTKGTPTLQADLLGDWREEVLWRNETSEELRLYSTPIPTGLRIRTLMHDAVYRLGVAWQNVAYNQPPHTGFFLGAGMTMPGKPGIVMP